MSPSDALAGREGEALALDGAERIEWVRRHSPVLDGYVRQAVSNGALRGKRVAVVVHLEAKTAFLATVLADAGAEVIAAGSNPRTTDASVVAALRARGMTVVAEAGGDYESWERELLAAADCEPDYIIDDGAELTMRTAEHRPDVFARLKGVSEETTTGTARLQAMEAAGNLPFPALTANDARCKHLFDNRYATGQTTLQAILRLTNRQIAGARVAVVGYGYVGKGLALYAQAMGARTFVTEVDPVRALEAHTDGHTVGARSDIFLQAEIIITATGGMRAIGADDISLLADEVVLANAGHHDLEVDTEALGRASSHTRETRPGITSYRVEGKDLHVLAGGALVNIAGGSGHPVEVMDLTFAVQGLGVHHLASNSLAPGVHVLPKHLDDSIATAKLASYGIELDQLRSDQKDDHTARMEGDAATAAATTEGGAA